MLHLVWLWIVFKLTFRPNQDWFAKDLSECILTNDPECDFGSDYLIEQQLTYFCGSAPECRQVGNYKALKLAKYNTEMYYSVIGITEHMRISLATFEEYFPRLIINHYICVWNLEFDILNNFVYILSMKQQIEFKMNTCKYNFEMLGTLCPKRLHRFVFNLMTKLFQMSYSRFQTQM